jgi:site-specific recombinase XerD
MYLHGKGRKDRVVPLWRKTTQLLRAWLPQIDSAPQPPHFPNHFGQPITRPGVEKRLQVAVAAAREQCPSLRGKKVSSHVLRHTTAMHLLQSGVDLAVIALWLGHESIATTHGYLQADLQMKEQAPSRLQEPETPLVRFTPSDNLLAFLDHL